MEYLEPGRANKTLQNILLYKHPCGKDITLESISQKLAPDRDRCSMHARMNDIPDQGPTGGPLVQAMVVPETSADQ